MTIRDNPNTVAVADTLVLLSDPVRRLALTEVVEANGRANLDGITEAVSRRGAAESADSTDTVPGDGDALGVALHHVHLPKLDDAGWIRYDSEARVAATGPHAETIDASLRAAVDELAALQNRLASEPTPLTDDD